ncbi:MAG: carboxypeptidase-like regulatory domain-containing protein [Anaerolineae bacterium]
MNTRRRWITVLLGSISLLMLLAAVAAAGPADPPDREFDLLIEVAHPRGAIISDIHGAVENFAHGDGRTVYAMPGEVIRFKSGFGYEGVWYADATGTLSSSLELYLMQGDQNQTPLGEDSDEATHTGPKIESGSLNVDVRFDEPGAYHIRSHVVSTARPVAQTTDQLIQDVDDISTTVVVLDPAELGSISGTVTDERTGDPIPGVVVIAGNPETQFHRRTRTDNEGNYTVAGLIEGEYLVGAVGRRQGYLTELYDNARRREDATPVPVTAGSDTPDINFALARRPVRSAASEVGLNNEPDGAVATALAFLRPADVPPADVDDGPRREFRQLHEVAHPRAAVAGAIGAAENFAHGDGHTITVRRGTTVRFKSGFGYEGVWFQGPGVITFGIEVCIVQDDGCAPAGHDVDVYRGRAPRIQAGSAHTDVTFNQIGTFEVRSRVLTITKPADGPSVRDEDVVTTFVQVVDADQQPADQ